MGNFFEKNIKNSEQKLKYKTDLLINQVLKDKDVLWNLDLIKAAAKIIYKHIFSCYKKELFSIGIELSKLLIFRKLKEFTK